MIIAIIVLSTLVFLLCVVLLLCAFKLFDLNAKSQMLAEMLEAKEHSVCRIQSIVYRKFGYNVPASDKYLSIAEMMHEKEAAKRQEGE